jgi:hypothetical protein
MTSARTYMIRFICWVLIRTRQYENEREVQNLPFTRLLVKMGPWAATVMCIPVRSRVVSA